MSELEVLQVISEDLVYSNTLLERLCFLGTVCGIGVGFVAGFVSWGLVLVAFGRKRVI